MHLFVVFVLLVFGFPFIINEVVNSFSKCSRFFLDGQPPVIFGILERSVSQDNKRYKLICQKYDNDYRFATLYDTTNRIPVFSAYNYVGRGTFKRPNKWMVESQLDPPVAEMTVLTCANQAISKDYRNNKDNVNRGHLFPCSHAADLDTAKSTFTLTNIVPQKISFNSGSWNRMERETEEIMKNKCYDKNNKVLAHVLTGVIPGNNKLNERVNIPSFMWMAFCCYNSKGGSWISQAYWAQNIDENINEGKIIDKKSLQELQTFLDKQWKKTVQLFNNNNCKK